MRRRELVLAPTAWKTTQITDDSVLVAPGDPPVQPAPAHSGTALEHVFTVLGLAFPAEPLRVALHAVQTDESELRETALEYLASVLPADVRAQLWPLIDADTSVTTTPDDDRPPSTGALAESAER